jgi:hypothetical protein
MATKEEREAELRRLNELGEPKSTDQIVELLMEQARIVQEAARARLEASRQKYQPKAS